MCAVPVFSDSVAADSGGGSDSEHAQLSDPVSAVSVQMSSFGRNPILKTMRRCKKDWADEEIMERVVENYDPH